MECGSLLVHARTWRGDWNRLYDAWWLSLVCKNDPAVTHLEKWCQDMGHSDRYSQLICWRESSVSPLGGWVRFLQCSRAPSIDIILDELCEWWNPVRHEATVGLLQPAAVTRPAVFIDQPAQTRWLIDDVALQRLATASWNNAAIDRMATAASRSSRQQTLPQFMHCH